MKKLSISLLVMLLIASLFTSCSMGSDDASDVRVKVRLTPSGGGRSLNTDIETINLDDDSITWHYSATKVSETQFNYGATSDSILPKDGIVTLSQGNWTIGLRGEKDGKNVFAGTIDKTIKWNFYEPNVTVQVPVNENTGDKGFIVLTDVKIKVGESEITPNYASIDGIEITNLNGSYMKIECAPGTHSVTFAHKEGTSLFGKETISVEVKSGLETKVIGYIDGTGSSGSGESQTTIMQPIEGGVKTTEEVKVESSIVPATTSTTETKTTVTFPAGSFNDDSSNAVLNLSVKSAGKITVTSTEVPVFAGIDISVLVNNQPVTEFNGKEVVIETYIAKDLTNVSVKYNGSGDQPIATDDSAVIDKTVAAELNSFSLATDLGYNKQTGLLRFKTNHFSEYYVLATVEALNVNTGVPYTSLASAIADAKDGQEVKVMSNVNITSPIYVNKNLILDLNEKNITGTGTRIFNVTAGTLEISGTGILSSSNIAVNSSVIRVGSNENSTPSKAGLIVGQSVKISGPNSYGVTVFGSTTQETIVINGTIESYSGAVSGNGSNGYGGTTIIINEGASLSATNASGIYHPQSGDLIINGGSITGTTGIEIKSGNASVSVNGNLKITATGKIDHTASSNGNSSSGYSIAVVENKDYTGDVTVEIESGSFTGPVCLLKDSDSSYNFSIQIKGGTFSSDPSEYLAHDYVSVKTGDSWVIKKAPSIMIGEKKYSTMEEAVNAAEEGDVILLGEGEYSTYGTTYAWNKTLSFKGQGPDKTVWLIGHEQVINGEGGADYSFENSNVTFSDLTIQDKQNNANYRGFVRCSSLAFNNCKFNSRESYWGIGTVDFTNCTFNDTGDWSLWCYSGTQFNFNGCTFNTSKKGAINLYQENIGNKVTVNVNSCVFNLNNSEPIDKPVIQVGEDYTDKNEFTLNIVSAEINGNYAVGSFEQYPKYVLNKNNKSNNKLRITIDGKLVYGVETV